MSIDFAEAWNTGRKMIESSIALLPNMILAAVIFIIVPGRCVNIQVGCSALPSTAAASPESGIASGPDCIPIIIHFRLSGFIFYSRALISSQRLD
jgi:hypothetical protein